MPPGQMTPNSVQPLESFCPVSPHFLIDCVRASFLNTSLNSLTESHKSILGDEDFVHLTLLYSILQEGWCDNFRSL